MNKFYKLFIAVFLSIYLSVLMAANGGYLQTNTNVQQLDKTVDFHTLLDNGIYGIPENATLLNGPSIKGIVTLQITNAYDDNGQATLMQIVHSSDGQIFSETYSFATKTWSKWVPASASKGDKGDTGDSAYQVWLKNGHTGTESDFLSSLKGAKGESGPQGPTGKDGIAGKLQNIEITSADNTVIGEVSTIKADGTAVLELKANGGGSALSADKPLFIKSGKISLALNSKYLLVDGDNLSLSADIVKQLSDAVASSESAIKISKSANEKADAAVLLATDAKNIANSKLSGIKITSSNNTVISDVKVLPDGTANIDLKALGGESSLHAIKPLFIQAESISLAIDDKYLTVSGDINII